MSNYYNSNDIILDEIRIESSKFVAICDRYHTSEYRCINMKIRSKQNPRVTYDYSYIEPYSADNEPRRAVVNARYYINDKLRRKIGPTNHQDNDKLTNIINEFMSYNYSDNYSDRLDDLMMKVFYYR